MQFLLHGSSQFDPDTGLKRFVQGFELSHMELLVRVVHFNGSIMTFDREYLEDIKPGLWSLMIKNPALAYEHLCWVYRDSGPLREAVLAGALTNATN